MLNLNQNMPTIEHFFNKGYVTTDVSSVKVYRSNTTKENRIKWVTDLAAVSRGKSESTNPTKRFNSLMKEAALGTASRPMEFLPVVLDQDRIRYLDKRIFSYESKESLLNNLLRYSYCENGKVYTNMRALLNIGVKIENIPYNDEEDLKDFKAIKIKVPMFIWSQLMTHTALSKESQSDRVAEENDYYLPTDFVTRVSNLKIDTTKLQDLSKSNPILAGKIIDLRLKIKDENEIFNCLFNNFSQHELFFLFEFLDYKREIWSRAIYYFKYKVMIMTGWSNDPSTWKHLFIERNCVPELWKNWTQKETQIVVEKIKSVLGM